MANKHHCHTTRVSLELSKQTIEPFYVPISEQHYMEIIPFSGNFFECNFIKTFKIKHSVRFTFTGVGLDIHKS